MARAVLACPSMMLSETLRSGAVTTVGTTLALLAFGKRHTRSAWEPIDAVSHIVWGDRGYGSDRLDVKHTLVGTLLNTAALVSWAGVQELVLSRRRTLPVAIATGAATAALAYVVDYHVVPERVTPGFQWKLPRRALRLTYVAMALSLVAGGMLAGRR